VLHAGRAALDAIFEDWIALADAARLVEILSYTNWRGQPSRHYVCDALDHAFNHQTHHRSSKRYQCHFS